MSGRCHPAPSRQRTAVRGSVIVLVLVTLVFAAMVLTRLIESGSPDLLIAMRQADRNRLAADARAALETTLAVLMDFRVVDGALYAPEQGWADPLGYAGYQPRAGVTCEVAFEDESAKLSLPRLTPDLLAALLGRFGLGSSDATRVADAMAVWMHNGYPAADSSFSVAAYGRGDPAIAPPLRSLRSYDELANILVARDFFYDRDGRPTPLLAAFREHVSLYAFNATNLNSVSELPLLARGWDGSQVQALRSYRTATGPTPHYFRSVQQVRRLAGNPAMHGLGVEIQLLWIHVTVREGAARLRLSALVTWAGQAALPAPVAAEQATTAGNAVEGPNRGRPGMGQAPAVLHYPFTVLEFDETALPASPSTPR